MMSNIKSISGALLLAFVVGTTAFGHEGSVTVTFNVTTEEGAGEEIGTIDFQDSKFGLIITPHLENLSVGPHGLHIHANPSCSPAKNNEGTTVIAGAAGGHFDPQSTGMHLGPYEEGHLGDLPNLYVESDGKARIPVLAPRVTTQDLKGHALMIHSGADRYDKHHVHDHGKGGARVYCGVGE